MPPQALALALAASIYPPAVLAVIALGRGSQVRSRVLAFVLAAAAITYAVGTLALFLLDEIGATGPHHLTPSAALDLALGVLLLGFAVRLHRKQPASAKPKGASKIERYLQSRRLAFVLGLTLYVLPSPIYIAAVKEISDAKLSTSGKLLGLLVTVAVMLWLIELPMLALLLVPSRASTSLEQINAWFTRRGRLLAVLACAAAGAYLMIKGLINLIS
ncbi:MAG TPA: GAP family protein [Solirubrobacteraceae bacterium]